MKTCMLKKNVLLPVLLGLACAAAGAATSGEWLQQGLYAEEIEGDLPTAITSYERVIDDPASAQDHVVQALYRVGLCYERLGDDQKAAAALNRLVSRYPDRTELAQKAKVLLDKLQYFDPAALMPPDTLVYLEQGSPGTQIERLLRMLDLSPNEDPLALFMRTNGTGQANGPTVKITQNSHATGNSVTVIPRGPVAGLSRFMNPSMLAELKKVRSLAVGSSQINPQGTSSFICVMHPGESDALRGMIIAGLGMAGRPADPVEGMTMLQIQDGPAIAYDDKIILIAYPREQLVWSIRQYKGAGTGPSLASGNVSFHQVDKLRRQQMAATLWINIDELYSEIQRNTPDLPPAVKMVAGMVNIASIDDLLVTHAIEEDGVGLDVTVHLKEGMSNMLYEMIRTPTIGAPGLEAVPAEAFCLISMAPAGAGSAQVQQLSMLAQNALGMAIPPEFFASIEQVSLFALPGPAAAPSGMPFRPGLAIQCRDTAPVTEMLQAVLARANPPVAVEAVDGFVLVAQEQAVIDAAKDALKNRESVNEKGALHESVARQAGHAQKMIMVNAGGLVRLAGIQSEFNSGIEGEPAEHLRQGFDSLAAEMQPTTLAVWSDEQPQALSLHARLAGIPSLKQLLGPIEELRSVFAEIERQQAEAEAAAQAEREQLLLEMPPARIVHCAAAPVIDGKPDPVWNRAETYLLKHTIYENPGPENRLAADYRMLWDADNLYVYIDVTDSSPVHDLNQIWQFTDGIEFYLDATDSKPSGYGETQYQFGFVWDRNPTAVRLEQGQGRHVHNASMVITTTEKGYQVEASFPWNELGTTAKAGARIGVEVQVNDNRGRGERDAKISWHDPYDQAWLNPRYFGRAELMAAEAE